MLDQGGETEVVALDEGRMCVAPRASWHRLLVNEPGTLFFASLERSTGRRGVRVHKALGQAAGGAAGWRGVLDCCTWRRRPTSDGLPDWWRSPCVQRQLLWRPAKVIDAEHLPPRASPLGVEIC